VEGIGLDGQFSRWACFAPTGQWGSVEGGQSQLTGKVESWGLVSWHLSKIGGCCGSAQAAGEGCGQRWVGGRISRWACFPAPTGQWGSVEGGQSQLPGKREPRGFVSWHLSKIDGCCGSAQAAGEGCDQRWVGGRI
jgi:hypothetical protein